MKSLFRMILVTNLFIMTGCGSNKDSTSDTNINTQQEFLPVEKAFMFSANSVDKSTLRAHWVIAEGYHLYKDKFKFTISPANYEIIEVKYPKAEVFSDKNLGKLESYKGSVEVIIKFSGKSTSDIMSLTSEYQGCADVGLCYPPESKVSDFDPLSM